MLKINYDDNLKISNVGLYESLTKNEELGFLKLPYEDRNWQESTAFAKKISSQFDHLVIIGMGGSALGAKALVDCFGDSTKVSFWSDSDPELIKSQLFGLEELERTAWLVISKSGKTIEVMALLNYASQIYTQRGVEFFKNVFVITQFNENPLYSLVQEKELPCLEHPQNVGGRFSVFSPVGLVPAIFSGIDANLIRQGANRSLAKEGGLDLYSFMHLPIQKQSQVFYFWIYDSRLYSFGDWLEQLWAESLGQKSDINKNELLHFGVPVILHGTKDHHSSLQQVQDGNFEKFVLLISGDDRESQQVSEANHFSKEEYLSGLSLERVHDIFKEANIQSLKAKGIPFSSLSIDVKRPDDLCELMMSFEVLIGLIGQSYNFNPFDQPGVELCKRVARNLLADEMNFNQSD